MIVPRSGSVTYYKATQNSAVPTVRIRLVTGQSITPAEWPEIEGAIAGVDGAGRIHLSTGRNFTYILVRLATTPTRYTDAGMVTDCQAICSAAKVTIVKGPSLAV